MQIPNVSWVKLAEQWHDSYVEFAHNYDPSTSPFVSFDEHMLTALDQVLANNGLTGLWIPDDVSSVSRIWHYLDPWADSQYGIAALKKKFPVCALSNGNTAVISDMEGWNKIQWTRIFTAETFKAYKPNPLVYEGAAKELGLETNKCALIAAHLGDLKAAKGCGYQTVYVERDGEERLSSEEVENAKNEGWVDMWVELEKGAHPGQGVGFIEVAKRFGLN